MRYSIPMTRETPLAAILAELGAPPASGGGAGAGRAVGGVRYDSRLVRPGDLFVAVPGYHVDGHDFVGRALAAGAAAVVVEAGRREAWAPQVAEHAGTPIIAVADTRAALAAAAAAFYGHPARKLHVIGITGTDGKTTTSYLTNAVLEAAGHRTGLVGTVEHRIAGRAVANDSRQTTPEAPEVQELLAAMVEAGCDYAIIESTSHGLELHRLDGCEYDVAALTNVTSDHLDFHGTREAYIGAKARLFAMLDTAADKGSPKWAVLNADDPASATMRTTTARARSLTYALDSAADLRALDIVAGDEGSRLVAVYGEERWEATIALPGRFNVANALAAIAIGLTQGIALADACRGVATLASVPGRMERIDEGQPFTVIVDYAHTEAALRTVLTDLRASSPGRLLVVFGAAGERDAARRSGLGRAAAELADRLYITTEDPREEDPAAIIAEIAAAVEGAGRREGDDFLRIPDRAEAIAAAVKDSRPGDVILIAGKGHEGSIIVGRERLPWDDRAAAREAIRDNRSTP
ncbi:MAG: UDP-N-acetylmuramoyl-L-alanyl-D-glutamate--2,6-diaminopimelate ligase [Dehalococcoidia bacterium]|nr:UDP-N-acetylmuramoyl-L-alanyl-D-glutamate--2,6-diaminopimelate ligase [Dehalococcoidia bacterium]